MTGRYLSFLTLLILLGLVRGRGSRLQFTRSVYNTTIPENSVAKTYVTSQVMMGMYVADTTLDVRYKIVSGDKDRLFKAETHQIGDFCFLAIRTRTGIHAVLNREYQDWYKLDVRAMVTSSQKRKVKLKAQTYVNVQILDTNDLNPLFYPTDYEINITEDTPLYRSVLQVSAFDADIGVNGEIYYRFFESTLQFAIHATNGIITLTRPLDHQQQSHYELTVVAEDRGPKFRAGDVRASSATVRINVTPVNLHSPEIFVRHFASVLDARKTTTFAVITVMDNDVGIHGQIQKLEITVGNTDGHFRIVPGLNPNEYNLMADGKLTPLDYALTLKATDRGIPPKSTSQTIHFRLPKVDDSVPVFEQSYYEVTVQEVSPAGTPVVLVTATTPHNRNSDLFYSIEDSDENSVFAINSRTGLLYVAGLLDRETRNQYVLMVIAVDKSVRGIRAKGSAQVTIQVLDANDNDPVFNSTSVNVDFDENRPAGSTVYTVYAYDSDEGENGYVSYSLANLSPVPFEIDSFTGRISTTAVLDYETMRRQYLLKIRAADWGTPYRRQTEMSLKIRLRDINDHRPLFEKINCIAYVSSLAPRGTEVIKLSAVDFDAGSVVQYRMVPSHDDPCFSLNASNGLLTLTCDLNKQKFHETVVNVTATDGKHFSDVVPVTMKVVSNGNQQTSVECKDLGVAERLKEQTRLGELNNKVEDTTEPTPTTFRGNKHWPEFPSNAPTEAWINESVAVGTEVALLSAKDLDRGYNGRLVYVITSGDDDSCFQIDLFTGSLRIFKPLDREMTEKYILNVTALDLGEPQKSAHKFFTVNVLDDNDNEPVFEKSSYSFVVPENVHNGTSIVRLRATDEDSGANSELKFSMNTPTEDFAIDSESGLLFVKSPLDREKVNEYLLEVKVSDLSPVHPLSSTTTVSIRVLDINDNPPKFTLPQFWVKVREDLPPGTVIMVLSAQDPDLGSGGKVKYEILGGSGGKFSIDVLMGVVRLSDQLDFEQTQLYNLTVMAQDGGTPPLSTITTLIVEVEDVNENVYPPRFSDVVVISSVRENMPSGTLVKRVSAVDEDGPGVNGMIVYSIIDGDGMGLFSINDKGEVRTRSKLDRETKSRYWLTIHARDRAAIPLSSLLYLYVEVLDENDNTPLTAEPVYYVSVDENSPSETTVIKLNAFDLDTNIHQNIVFAISTGDPEGYFSIDPGRGIITTTSKVLDREEQDEYILEITVNDNGKPPLFSVTRVVITVNDDNDNAPEFRTRKYHCHVLEMTKSSEDVLLCQILAIDADIGSNGDITYEIMEGDHNGRFKIHPKLGSITTRSQLNAGEKYELIVKASDNGNLVQSASARVLLDVVSRPKISIHPPVVKDIDTISVVAETDMIGHLVALVQASDADGDRLWYYIQDGNTGNTFVMQQPDIGAILLQKQLNWEIQSKYNLTIATTDGVHIVYHVLQVEVKDENNHRPEFSERSYKVEVSENIKPGTEILQLQAIDTDQDKRLFYSIVNSAISESQKLFHIDSSHGLVSIARPLDREIQCCHILTIMVNDYGTPSKRDFSRMVVTVLDHNDHAPEFLLTRYQAFILESSALRTAVLQVKAIDRDKGINAQISYSITSGNIGSVFSIDSALGIIRVFKQLNRNTMPEFFLTVRATDHGTPPLNSSVTAHLVVTIANNAPPKFEQQEYVAEIYEDEKIGASVAVLTAASRSSVFYEIISGNVDETFAVNPTSGVVHTNIVLDYEFVKFYNLTIQATNMVNGNSTAKLLIHVLDKNDNRPSFFKSEYYGIIRESAVVGSIVLTNESHPLVVAAVDNDSNLNSMLSYKITEKFGSEYFQIDHSTGAIRTKLPLDYEENNEYLFTVQVTDHGWPQLSAEVPAIVHISVINVNDRPPAFEKNIYTATLLLPTYQGVLVKSVHAFDPDSSVIRYSIVSGNQGLKFSINETSGDIYVKNHLGLNKEYNLIISASDGEFEASSKLIIIVEDIQPSSRQFSRDIYSVSIAENYTDIHIVAIVNVIGTELDEYIFFKILNPSNKFNIGETSGVIRNSGIPLDRETCDNYPLVVEARSRHLEDMWVAHTLVNITVIDINDNKPIFINMPYYTLVPIEANPGDLIQKVEAIDLDSGMNAKLHYELIHGDYNLFDLNTDTGEIFLHKSLDDQQKEYELVIAAVDGGIPPLRTQITVPVKVVNRAMPIFTKHFYSISVKEDVPASVPILTVTANSPEGRQLIYSLVSGNNMEDFQLDFNAAPANSNSPCVMYIVEELDYETTQQYQLTLRATDTASGVYAEIPIHIKIEDVNDNPPMFSQPVYNTTVSEAMPFGTSILVVRATDRDSGENQLINYQILGNATAHFHMDPEEGIIFIKQSLDHETDQEHHFIVVATDKGIPHLSSTAHVWIIVKDINDNPPVFHYPSYRCAISEHARRGQFVTMVVASDPDMSNKGKLKYSIVSGNGMQIFSINHKTGIITLSNLRQFSQQSSYFLNVSVTDDVYSSYTLVHITVYSANLNAPQFMRTMYGAAIQENKDIGTYVTTVSARDNDSGQYGKITYSIQSDLLQKYFRIVPDSGKIYTNAILDRERMNLYKIPVMACDGGGKLSYTMVRVTVTDDNDNTPHFVVAQYKATLAANTTVGTTILKVQAVDADDSSSGAIEYSIYNTNSSSNIEIFGMMSMNGELYVKKKITDFENYDFQFFVQAKDRGIPSKTSVVPLTIRIFPSYVIIPRFEHQTLEFFVSEKSAIGTIISVLNVSIPVTSSLVTYSIVSAPNDSPSQRYLSKFSINKFGHLLLVSELDREEESTYFLTVEAKMKRKPQTLAYINIIIQVMDENNNPPEMETSSYHVIIAENIDEGSAVLKITAHDADLGRNADIMYRFADDMGDAAGMFHLNSKTGWLTTIETLDRETVSWYNFTVIAEDDGIPSYSTSALVIIQLQDYNDNPPLFQMQRYTTSVSEDALPGTIIVKLETTDADEIASNTIKFYITNGNPKDQFDVRQTGEVFVSKSLDREDISNYLLEVTVTDGTFVSHTWVSVDVLDVNDNPPVCLKSKYTELVSESIASDTYILTVEATDADDFRNAQLQFFLSGHGSEDFSIGSSSGLLKTAKPMDREQHPRYILKAHVQDQGRPDWECTSQIEILLGDVNDNTPLFNQEEYSVAVPEDSEIGTLVTKVHATDKDLGYNRKIAYSFVDSAHEHFAIDKTTGIVQLKKPLDREERAMYNLTIQAEDHGTPQLSSSAILLVMVQDVNDNPPEFAQRFYFATVSETSKPGTEVLRILATSKDSGVNAEISYSLVGGNTMTDFTIHPKSGIISVAELLDYEDVHEYMLIVQATDGGTPPLHSRTTVNISITDSNDNAPVFTQSSYRAVIREDALIGDKIIQVMATDADSPPNARLSYAITGGDRQNQFRIDELMGYISVASSLDREVISAYVLEIECTDSGIPSLSTVGLVNIEVSDVNDNPPLFSQANYTALVQEGKPLGFTVLKFTVTDADAPLNAAPFKFDILSGNEEKAFRIVQQDGTLRTATKFDHKYRNQYSLHIRVTDNGNPPLNSETWVVVIVIEESQYAPVITPLDVAVSSYLDDFPGGVVGRVHATDNDPYDKLTYDIVSSHQSLFTVDREDGTLFALAGLDVGTYDVNISVTDGKFISFTTVTVEVAMVTEDALKHSVAIQLNDVTPEDFLLTYRKGFLRGLRNILNVRTKDVEIISMQPTLDDHARKERSAKQDLDVVFAVHKGSHGFYPPKLVQTKIKEKKETLEASLGLTVVKVMENRCTSDKCIYGQCVDHIILDRTSAYSVTTDAISYVSPHHYRKLECQCDPGYGGAQCDLAINECARKPCPLHRMCVSDTSPLGYSCECPIGKSGPLCDWDKEIVCEESSCYEEKKPISFGGKSYACYILAASIDRHLSIVLRLRTKQSTGNLMYAAGIQDYSILEVQNGLVQYRLDCGSGEGLVRVEHIRVNDGNWHEVRLERRGNTAELIVDRRYRASGSSPGFYEVLNLDGSDVYFGAEVHSSVHVDVRMGFVGCMDEVLINGISLPLHVTASNPVATLRRFVNVDFHCRTLFDPGVCGSQPCQNGGTCQSTGNTFTCQCLPRFLGTFCEIDTNPCDSSPCLNGGTCHNTNRNFKCDCPVGLSGKRCDYGRYCNPNPCHNGGVCEEGTATPICKCPGFHGELCQHNIDECQNSPCASGATCIDMHGAFRCQCPPNMTGSLCMEHIYITSITSSSWNTTIEEIIGIALVIFIIFLLAVMLVCCWRYRYKRQHQRPNNENVDAPGPNEFLLKNPVGEKENVQRLNKITNLEVTNFTTPPLPPRPSSYTPTTQESLTTLNNFDRVRSYGSAADDLDNIPRYTSDLQQNVNRALPVSMAPNLPPLPSSNSASDSESLRKSNWERENSNLKDKIFEDKIQIVQPKPKSHPTQRPVPAVPSRGPSSLGLSSVMSLNSVDNLAADPRHQEKKEPREDYQWDYSDWAANSQRPKELSLNELKDSSSVPSTESNSQLSQIELLPTKKSNIASPHGTNELQQDGEDFDLPDSYIGDSEYNDNELDDAQDVVAPNFEQLLTDLEFMDDGTETLSPSPKKYQSHPNQYLPSHFLSSDVSPESSIHPRKPLSEFSDDDIVPYGFPSQGHRTFQLDPDSNDPPVDQSSALDTMSMSVCGYTSTNASYSDISGIVCEIEDSDVDCDTTGSKRLPRLSRERTISTAV